MVARRQMAAGDQLRVVYDQLSRDPASLSNLDQDLPNYAQHQVPIFSLPQVRQPPPQACHRSSALMPQQRTVPHHTMRAFCWLQVPSCSLGENNALERASGN